MVISNFSWRGSLYVPVLMGFSRKQSLKLSLCGSTPVRVQSRGSKNEWYKKKESKYEMCVTKLATASEKASLVCWSCRRSHGKSQKHCTDQPIRGRRAAYLLVPSHLLPFPTQGLNPGLPNCRWILYPLRHQGSPWILGWVTYLFSRGSFQQRNQSRVSCIAGLQKILYQLSYQGSPRKT